MADANWTDGLTALLARVKANEPGATDELFAKVYERLRQLARTMLPWFPAVQKGMDATDLAHDLYIGLLTAFRAGHVPTDEHEFLKFAGFKLRRMLLDLKDRAKVREVVGSLERLAGAGSSSGPGYEPDESTYNPEQLAKWTEFHEAVGRLPEELRVVVELHFYAGLSQADAAARLGLTPKAASRQWLDAVRRVGPAMPPTR